MPIINFSDEFADMVESGKKRQTIRSNRRKYKAGDKLHLWTGLHTTYARKLGIATVTEVASITILPTGAIYIENNQPWIEQYSASGNLQLAKRDGFTSLGSMVSYLDSHYGLPFHGQVIRWELEL